MAPFYHRPWEAPVERWVRMRSGDRRPLPEACGDGEACHVRMVAMAVHRGRCTSKHARCALIFTDAMGHVTVLLATWSATDAPPSAAGGNSAVACWRDPCREAVGDAQRRWGPLAGGFVLMGRWAD